MKTLNVSEAMVDNLLSRGWSYFYDEHGVWFEKRREYLVFGVPMDVMVHLTHSGGMWIAAARMCGKLGEADGQCASEDGDPLVAVCGALKDASGKFSNGFV